jgi:hypothetical protein
LLESSYCGFKMVCVLNFVLHATSTPLRPFC